jgi:hypothetical protein
VIAQGSSDQSGIEPYAQLERGFGASFLLK